MELSNFVVWLCVLRVDYGPAKGSRGFQGVKPPFSMSPPTLKSGPNFSFLKSFRQPRRSLSSSKSFKTSSSLYFFPEKFSKVVAYRVFHKQCFLMLLQPFGSTLGDKVLFFSRKKVGIRHQGKEKRMEGKTFFQPSLSCFKYEVSNCTN